ncbi:MAG: hypothetical protein QM813_19495 [Verrucomicrobiota bacterium]
MKTLKLTLTALAGVLLVSSTQAQVEINISGAVAFRSTAYRAIRSLFLNNGGTLTSQNPADGSGTPAQLKVTWTGTIPSLYGAQTVTVRAFYNGAVAGIQDLTQDRLVQFLATSTPGDTTLSTDKKADIAFSSTYQASTEFNNPILQDEIFGVTPINLVKSTVGTAGITNITSHQLRTLAANGSLPAWFFTGNTNDTQTIYFINRDPTAGQRVVLFADALYNGSPISYFWTNNALGYVVDATGRSATQITTHLTTYSNAISYLISEDSYNVNTGLNILSYNGNKAFKGTFSNTTTNDFNPVIDGQYSLWVYEHLLNKTTAASQVTAFRGALVAAIQTELQTSSFSIPEGRVRVERQADGAPVAPK